MKKLLLFYLVFISISGFSQEKRLALIIGNSAYEHGGVLRNPVNDANAMKQALSQVGFKIQIYYNLDEGEMKESIDKFGLILKDYNVGLFFYAGHGIQVNGENYLIPVDANITSEQQVEYDCVEAERALAVMDASNATVKIVILDACRNNPFERSWTRTSEGKGLAFMNAPSGTLIAYATAPGTTASDGSGINGLYTSAILESMQIQDITILQVFQNVRNLVSQVSQGKQIPWESTSLIGDFYFSQRELTNIDYYEEDEGIEDIGVKHKGVYVDPRDGEEYEWIGIGEQIWMAENLRATHYADGKAIELVENEFEWESLKDKDKAYCWYSNNESLGKIYGALYTWAAAMNGEKSSDSNPSGVQGVCPDGWHIPSDEEWKQLEMYLGMNQNEINELKFRGTTEGEKLKEPGTKHWVIDTINISKSWDFNALPGGCRYIYGGFEMIGESAVFWTATEGLKNTAWDRYLSFAYSKIGRHYNTFKIMGLSVRCIKD